MTGAIMCAGHHASSHWPRGAGEGVWRAGEGRGGGKVGGRHGGGQGRLDLWAVWDEEGSGIGLIDIGRIQIPDPSPVSLLWAPQIYLSDFVGINPSSWACLLHDTTSPSQSQPHIWRQGKPARSGCPTPTQLQYPELIQIQF